MVLGVQIIGVLFGLFMLYYTFINYKKNEIRIVETLFWEICWIVFIFITVFPNSLSFIVESLSLSRTMDFFTILGFLFLIGISYYNYMLSKKNRMKIEKLVREIAIKRAEK